MKYLLMPLLVLATTASADWKTIATEARTYEAPVTSFDDDCGTPQVVLYDVGAGSWPHIILTGAQYRDLFYVVDGVRMNNTMSTISIKHNTEVTLYDGGNRGGEALTIHGTDFGYRNFSNYVWGKNFHMSQYPHIHSGHGSWNDITTSLDMRAVCSCTLEQGMNINADDFEFAYDEDNDNLYYGMHSNRFMEFNKKGYVNGGLRLRITDEDNLHIKTGQSSRDVVDSDFHMKVRITTVPQVRNDTPQVNTYWIRGGEAAKIFDLKVAKNVGVEILALYLDAQQGLRRMGDFNVQLEGICYN